MKNAVGAQCVLRAKGGTRVGYPAGWCVPIERAVWKMDRPDVDNGDPDLGTADFERATAFFLRKGAYDVGTEANLSGEKKPSAHPKVTISMKTGSFLP